MELTKEFKKLMDATKTVQKLKDNIIQSSMKLYRQKSSPYRLTRHNPGKNQIAHISRSSNGQSSLKEIVDERTKELRKMMNIVESTKKMKDALILSTMELYRQKSKPSPYKWKRDSRTIQKPEKPERKTHDCRDDGLLMTDTLQDINKFKSTVSLE